MNFFFRWTSQSFTGGDITTKALLTSIVEYLRDCNDLTFEFKMEVL